MDRYLLVMLGAALGGASRYALTTVITEKFGGNFPLGTFLVNISGSFMIGAVMTIISDRLEVHPNWRLLLVVGLLGGYTTFSSLEFETLQAMRRGLSSIALVYSVGSLILGYVAVWLGMTIVSRT